MNWDEVLLVVIGAILGFALSIITTIVNRAIDRYGKLHLFYKFVYEKSTGKKARIDLNGCETLLIIPLYFELQNTSHTARVLRDVCLYLYRDGQKIAKMSQVQYTRDSKTGEIKSSYGGENNSYSFVLQPVSIQRQECAFIYKVPTAKIVDFSFDEIRFAYFNESNQIMECLLCRAENGWSGIEFNYENEYFELMCSRKKSKK